MDGDRRKSCFTILENGTFVKRMALDGQITYYDVSQVAPVMNALRIISYQLNN